MDQGSYKVRLICFVFVNFLKHPLFFTFISQSSFLFSPVSPFSLPALNSLLWLMLLRLQLLLPLTFFSLRLVRHFFCAVVMP